MAQLGARLNGIQEVTGSIPVGSTKRRNKDGPLGDEPGGPFPLGRGGREDRKTDGPFRPIRDCHGPCLSFVYGASGRRWGPPSQDSRRWTDCTGSSTGAWASSQPRCARGTRAAFEAGFCLLTETLSEHFAAEERMMGAAGWSRLAHHVACHRQILAQARALEHLVLSHGLTHELAALAMKHLPEMLRFHQMASDFGFGKFALGEAEDPGRRFARRVAGG